MHLSISLYPLIPIMLGYIALALGVIYYTYRTRNHN